MLSQSGGKHLFVSVYKPLILSLFFCVCVRVLHIALQSIKFTCTNKTPSVHVLVNMQSTLLTIGENALLAYNHFINHGWEAMYYQQRIYTLIGSHIPSSSVGSGSRGFGSVSGSTEGSSTPSSFINSTSSCGSSFVSPLTSIYQVFLLTCRKFLNNIKYVYG